jgi:hypothetical protein
VVTKTSKAAASAAANNAPLPSVAQPRSYAVSTACPTNAARRGVGVPWSNKMRMESRETNAGS